MAIRHLVLMRLNPGVFTPEARKDYEDTFAALKAALPEDILDANVYENVVDRPQNMTVMIEMILALYFLIFWKKNEKMSFLMSRIDLSRFKRILNPRRN